MTTNFRRSQYSRDTRDRLAYIRRELEDLLHFIKTGESRKRPVEDDKWWETRLAELEAKEKQTK
jgi:ribosomal protein S19E (S16A)